MDALRIAHIVLLLLVSPAFGLTLMKFRFYNPHAWLKQILFLWYALVPAVSVAQIVLCYFFPALNPIATYVYNLAGSLIVSAGIAENLQFMHVIGKTSSFKASNIKFLKVIGGFYAYGVVFFVVALLVLPVNVYRAQTMLLLVVECATSARTLSTIWYLKRKSVNIYYGANLCHRAFIVIGIICSVLGASKTVVTTIHFIATFCILGCVYSLAHSLSIQEERSRAATGKTWTGKTWGFSKILSRTKSSKASALSSNKSSPNSHNISAIDVVPRAQGST